MAAVCAIEVKPTPGSGRWSSLGLASISATATSPDRSTARKTSSPNSSASSAMTGRAALATSKRSWNIRKGDESLGPSP